MAKVDENRREVRNAERYVCATKKMMKACAGGERRDGTPVATFVFYQATVEGNALHVNESDLQNETKQKVTMYFECIH